MNYILVIVLAIFVSGCATTTSQMDLFSGSWVADRGDMYSMLVLRNDSTCAFYAKIGSPWAYTWKGYWQPERTMLMIMDRAKAPMTIAYISGRKQIRLSFQNEMYYFYQYGSGPSHGGL